MKNGWWSIKYELDGVTVRPSELSESTLAHIAAHINAGFHSGEILEEEDGDNED